MSEPLRSIRPAANDAARSFEPARTETRLDPAMGVRPPDLGGRLLPGARYTSPEFARAEWEGMWTKVWLLLGRADEMPEPGDYTVEEVGPESILIARQEDMSFKAFYNVCQHRGNRLVYSQSGMADRFRCAYHGWQYSLDGELVWAQDPEDIQGGDPCGRLKLVEVPCDTFAGFVWVNLDPECGSLKDYLGPIWDEWAAYPVAEMRRYLALSVRLPCNWKVVQDNFNESYHLPATHPQSAAVIEDGYYDTEFYEFDNGHGLMKMKAGQPARRLAVEKTPLMGEMLRQHLISWELDPDEFVGREFEARAALQKQIRRLAPSRGLTHYDKLTDEQLTDFFHYTLFPNFAVSITADGFHFLRTRPLGLDPSRCVLDNWFYATAPEGVTTPVPTPGGVVERDAVVRHETFDYGTRSAGYFVDQDLSNMLGQQQGFLSKGYRGATIAGQEGRIAHYHGTIDDYIEGRRPHRRPA